MTTPTRAFESALAAAYTSMLGLDGTTVHAAAEAAWRPGGPDHATLTARITARRETTR